MRNEIYKNKTAKIWKTSYAKVEEEVACMIIPQFPPGVGILFLSLRCPLYIPTLCE